MKKLIAVTITALFLCSCAEPPRVPTQADVQMTVAQTQAQKACYQAEEAKAPDYSRMSVTEIALTMAVAALDKANARAAGKSTDPCAESAGTNFYDAEIVVAQESTKKTEAWLKFGSDIATKTMWGVIAGFGFDFLKGANGININNEGYQSSASLSDVGNESWMQTITTSRDSFSNSANQFVPPTFGSL